MAEYCSIARDRKKGFTVDAILINLENEEKIENKKAQITSI